MLAEFLAYLMYREPGVADRTRTGNPDVLDVLIHVAQCGHRGDIKLFQGDYQALPLMLACLVGMYMYI